MARKDKAETFRQLVAALEGARLMQPCPRCGAAALQRCQNYKGQRKATCRQRPTAAPVAIDPEPVGPLPISDAPMRQGKLYEYLDPKQSEVPG